MGVLRRDGGPRSRLQVIVVFPWGHLNQRVLQGSLARGLLQKPNLVEALPADAAAEVGVELMGWQRVLVKSETGC